MYPFSNAYHKRSCEAGRLFGTERSDCANYFGSVAGAAATTLLLSCADIFDGYRKNSGTIYGRSVTCQ
jgi:hypothetical protein